MEDAALLRPESGGTLAFTVDFITPIVDDAETFGAIAAANSMSDVYAMGGDPQVALAVCGFPEDKIDHETIARIFRGGRDKAAEAGCAIVGGHTVLDPELKYGLCVLGSVHPERRFTQTHGRAGDRLVLTKPIGIGIASQGIKQGLLSDDEIDQAVQVMLALNKDAKDAALEADVCAATDLTGFGLLGHLYHLLIGSKLAARLCFESVPVLPFVSGLAERGCVPGGSRRNLAYVENHVRWDAAISASQQLILADAQTSGGLLLAVAPGREATLVAELTRKGTQAAAVIGELVDGEAGTIEVSRSLSF